METNDLNNLRRLASLHIDGALDESGMTELESLLAGNKDAQAEYVKLLTTHSDLVLLSSYGIPDGTTKDVAAGQNDSQSNAAPQAAMNSTTKSSWRRYAAAALAIATCVVVTLFWQGAFTATPNDNQEVVARIVRKIDCDWEGDQWAVVSSSDIVAGQTLMMRRGLMELEFTSGARVTLEGPVAFTAESPMNGFLSQGKLTTIVPESAHGFTVNTPGSQTVDLGTEFGLFVGEDGTTETHVFEGEVIVKPSFDKTDEEILLSEDMALRTGGSEQIVSTLSAVPARFTHCKFEDKKSIPFPSVDRNLTLWFSAEHLVQLDEKQRVRSWGDIKSDSNLTQEFAWQVDESKRPDLVENVFGDKPAIRFSKKTVLVTEPVELASEQTIVAVFKINEVAMEKLGVPPQNGRQLINLNGPPHLSLRINDKLQLTSQNYAGVFKTKKGKKQYRTVGRLKYQQALDESAVVAVSLYNPSKDTSRLYINGNLVDRAKAPTMKSTKSPRYLGAHMFLPRTSFLGDVGELMVYDTALTKKEIAELSASLVAKYDIVVNEPATADKEKEETSKK